MVINTALRKCPQRKKENDMSNVNKIYKKVSELNERARGKGFSDESFIMIQSDGQTISFYGYFFETQTRNIDEYEQFIKKDLETLGYFLDNMNMI